MKTINSILQLIRETGAKSLYTNGFIYRLHWSLDGREQVTRYIVDCAEDGKNWDQFDTSQDASYFGTWVNPTELMILSFTEGDWALVICCDMDQYNAEIQSMIECYSPGRICTIMGSEGTTIYEQDRNEFFIKVRQ